MTSGPSSPQPAATGPRSTPTRAQRIAAWLGLCVVPLIWLLHLALGVTLVSRACADAVAQSEAPTWLDTQWIVILASLGAFLVALAITFAAGHAWRRIVYIANSRRDAHRFIAWCGATTSVAFTFGLAFSICVLTAVPLERLCVVFE
ncbi:hypothetical protein VSR34_35045 [Paraburkholderia sp. JHI2823]|uniref:hypothetical protein n=1 Tax=Paraburkholderia sp. JHI2823 TaxID=3112960 RepID=UPI003182B924